MVQTSEARFNKENMEQNKTKQPIGEVAVRSGESYLELPFEGLDITLAALKDFRFHIWRDSQGRTKLIATGTFGPEPELDGLLVINGETAQL